jgi:hypothetical protein
MQCNFSGIQARLATEVRFPDLAPSCLSGMSAVMVSVGGKADVPRTSRKRRS